MPHAPSHALEERHRRIRQAMRERSIEALVVTALPNICYLTNFTGSSAIAVLTHDRLHFITDSRYVTVIGDSRGTPSECPDLELVIVRNSYDASLAELIASMSARVGFESAHLSVSRHEWLLRALEGANATSTLLGVEGLVERARICKDSYEIDVLREAARRLSGVARAVVADVKRGRTEREVANAIDFRIRDAGFEKTAFDTIVAAGPNAALPHAHPGERRIGEDELVVLDFGGVYASYCVDLTRTVVVGRASARAREVYGTVLEAHDRAISVVRPGVSRFDIDGAARDVLVAAGMGEAFGHGTGHGLGIEVHEEPRVSRRRPGIDAEDADEDKMAPGMVFTIEPGAYFPGWSGVRIEDDVLVTDAGVDVLTDVTTQLLEI